MSCKIKEMKNTLDLIILGCLLLGLVLLGSMGVLSAKKVENFATAGSSGSACSARSGAIIRLQIPECPSGYKFFNDKAGESLCCKGSVDPYKHTCSAKGQNDICAFLDNVQDPRYPNRFLPQCAHVFETQYQDDSATNCPTGLPYFANDRLGNTKCCNSRPSDNGKRCSTVDMNDVNKYCIVDGKAKPDEQLCDDVMLYESARAGCPAGMNVTPIQLGPREESAYPGTGSLKVPACVNMTDTCIPDTVISQLQVKKKLYTGKNPATWSKSCSVWKKINVDRDTTFAPVTAYP